MPLAGRMGGIVDTYDALRSDRPHRNGESASIQISLQLAGVKKAFDHRILGTVVQPAQGAHDGEGRAHRPFLVIRLR